MPVGVRDDGPSLSVGASVALFATRLAFGANVATAGTGLARPRYSVATDGRFLLNEVVSSEADAAPLNVILNWDAALKK